MTQELWFETLGHSQSICINQYLSICTATRTNTNSCTTNRLCDFFRKLCRHFLKGNRKTTDSIKRPRIIQKFLCFGFFFGAKTITTKLMYALWRQSQMSHYRNTCIDNTFYGICNFNATLHFQGVNACRFHHPDSITDTFFTAHLIASERHITDNQTMLASTSHSSCMINHLIYANRKGGLIASHDIRSRVTHQDSINACSVNNACSSIIIGGKHCDFLTSLL